MTLRELLLSVNAELYAGSQLYQELLKVRPEYGSSRSIEVKLVDGNIVVTNVHVGSHGDIITYRIDVDPELKISKTQPVGLIPCRHLQLARPAPWHPAARREHSRGDENHCQVRLPDITRSSGLR